jgi:hypothetical protein
MPSLFLSVKETSAIAGGKYEYERLQKHRWLYL